MFREQDIEFTPSSHRHDIPSADAYYAMTHPQWVDVLDGEDGDVTRAFYGHPHPQTSRFIEVFAALKPDGRLVVFHAMDRPDLAN